MYINVISFKNGLKIPFTTTIPYSIDKVSEGWNVVTDEENGQVLSFVGSEIVTIASQNLEKLDELTPETPNNRQAKRKKARKKSGKKPALKTNVTTE